MSGGAGAQCRYIAETATAVSERLRRKAGNLETDVDFLADDVAWLARQVARLAEMLEPLSEAERIAGNG